MRCNESQNLLSAYLDEQLSVSRMRRVATHLDGCRTCSGELRDLASARDLLRLLSDPIPRPEFWMNAYDHVARNSPPLPWWRKLSNAQRSALVLAPGFTAGLVALLLFQPFSVPSSSPPDSMDDLVQAHLHARVSQAVDDSGIERLLLVDNDDDDPRTK